MDKKQKIRLESITNKDDVRGIIWKLKEEMDELSAAIDNYRNISQDRINLFNLIQELADVDIMGRKLMKALETEEEFKYIRGWKMARAYREIYRKLEND